MKSYILTAPTQSTRAGYLGIFQVFPTAKAATAARAQYEREGIKNITITIQ